MSRRSVRRWVIDRGPRLWVLWAASRPSQLALIGIVYLLGAGIALTGPPFVTDRFVRTEGLFGRLGIGLAVLMPIAVSIHYANEYADIDTDRRAKRTPFSGGSGALVRTDVSLSFLRNALVVMCVLALCALAVGFSAGLAPTAIGILGSMLGLGLAYSLWPFALIRRGAGEGVNVLLGGLLLPGYGAAMVGRPTLAVGGVVLPFCCVVGCSLLATHWPDRAADAAVGKRTLVVRWTAKRVQVGYWILGSLAVGSAVVLWVIGLFPAVIGIAHLVIVPLQVWGGSTITRQRSPLPSVLAMVVLAAGSTIGWWWVGWL